MGRCSKEHPKLSASSWSPTPDKNKLFPPSKPKVSYNKNSCKNPKKM